MDTVTTNYYRERDALQCMLAKQARKEIRLTGSTEVRCPKCGSSPKIVMIKRNERTILHCDCGYIHDGEINF